MIDRNHALAGRTIIMSGGSRGIGLAIALRAARDGANVALVAKTDQPDSRLPGTIHTAAAEIEAAGGAALPIVGDVRSEEQVEAAVAKTVERFGGIDIVVNNASAITLQGVLDLPIKRYDLMLDINARGTFVLTKLALPHLLKSSNPHVLTLSPPLNLDPPVVRKPWPLHPQQVRHDDAHTGRRRGHARPWRGRQLPLAADHRRHRRGPEPARR